MRKKLITFLFLKDVMSFRQEHRANDKKAALHESLLRCKIAARVVAVAKLLLYGNGVKPP